MQKKIAKNKVDSKDKKAPRKGASRESIFNYDIEVTEEMDKKREEKKLRLQKQREKEQKKIEKEKRKRLEKLKKEKSENQTIEVLTEEKFIGAKELPPVNKKAIEKLKKQKRKVRLCRRQPIKRLQCCRRL